MTKLSRDPHSVTALEQVLLEADDLNRKGNVQSAIQTYRDALGRTGNLPPFSECGSGWILISMATLERQTGRLDSAEALLNRAMTLAEAEEDAVALLTVTLELAATLTTKGDVPAALVILDRANLPPLGRNPDLDLAMTVELYKSKLLIETGDTEKARGKLQSLAPIAIAAGPAGLGKLATITSLQAHAHKEDGNFDEAIALFEEAITITEQAYWPDHPDVAADLAHQSACYFLAGDADKALAICLEANRIAERYVEKPEAELSRKLYRAQLLALTGALDDAETLSGEIQEMAAEILPPDHSLRISITLLVKKIDDAIAADDAPRTIN